jgi:hypothetical protein
VIIFAQRLFISVGNAGGFCVETVLELSFGAVGFLVTGAQRAVAGEAVEVEVGGVQLSGGSQGGRLGAPGGGVKREESGPTLSAPNPAWVPLRIQRSG